ncbi:hypothetical protein D3C78_1610840 [compost metagenome]
MLKESVNDADDFNIFTASSNARSKTANASDDQTDLNAGLRSFIQLVDDFLIGQAVHFGNNTRRLARQSIVTLTVNKPVQLFLQIRWRYAKRLPVIRRGIPRNLVEQCGSIGPNDRMGGKKPNIGI